MQKSLEEPLRSLFSNPGSALRVAPFARAQGLESGEYRASPPLKD